MVSPNIMLAPRSAIVACWATCFLQNSAFRAGKIDLFCPGCRDNLCRGKSTNEQRSKLFVLWKMENSISGAADRTWQHDAVMAFINGYL